MVLIELKANDRVLKTRAGLRDRVYAAYDRFGRLLLISGSLPPLVATINQLVNSPLDRVWHQSMYALANGRIKSGFHKNWACEELLPCDRVERINQLLCGAKWVQMGILTDSPEDWEIVRANRQEG